MTSALGAQIDELATLNLFESSNLAISDVVPINTMAGLLSFQVNPLFYYITTVLASPNTRDDSPLLF